MDGKNEEIIFAVFIGTIIMLAFCLGLFFLVLSYKNSFFRMKRKEADLLLKASLKSEQKERHRIAIDLHDSVSSDLSAIRNYLSVIIKKESDDEKLGIFNDLKIGVENAIENTRMVSYKLIPPLLEKYGLEVALDDLIKRLNTDSKTQYNFICDQKNLPISSHVAYEMYRILQEFTTNIGKYGASNNCTISLKKNQNFVEMLIVNDGKSYDFHEELKNSKGLGLKNIESRVKVIEGKLIQLNSLTSNIICITIPLISYKDV
jgi:signal transduction histidine kinase